MLKNEAIKIIRSQAALAEKKAQLSPKQLKLIYQNRWFHLLVPKSLGGKEMNLPEFVHFIEKLASIDGSFAWSVNLGAGANMFAGYMHQSTAKKIFRSPKSCVAGSGAIGGTAKAVKGGYIINGKWKYASGSMHASYFSLNATIDGEKDVYKSFLVPAKDVEILDTWHVMGLKASSSRDFKVKNVWVPSNYLFDLQQASRVLDAPLYRFPFNLLAEVNMLVMLSGMALNFRDLSKVIAQNKIRLNENASQKIALKDNMQFQLIVSRVENDFMKKRAHTFDLLENLWEKNVDGNEIEKASKSEFSMAVLQTANAARNLVDQLYTALGMSIIQEDTEISRVWKDFKVASQHSLLSPLRIV